MTKGKALKRKGPFKSSVFKSLPKRVNLRLSGPPWARNTKAVGVTTEKALPASPP